MDNDLEEPRAEQGTPVFSDTVTNTELLPRNRTPPNTMVVRVPRLPGSYLSESSSPTIDRNAVEDRSVSGSSSGTLGYVQLEAYNINPKDLFDLHDTQKDTLSRIVRTQIFPRVKFLPKSGKEHEKVSGTFWKPDLLVNTPRYVDAILDNFPDIRRRKEDDVELTDAVHFWIKASPFVRQVILDRRSNVTQRMKRELVLGTY